MCVVLRVRVCLGAWGSVCVCVCVFVCVCVCVFVSLSVTSLQCSTRGVVQLSKAT